MELNIAPKILCISSVKFDHKKIILQNFIPQLYSQKKFIYLLYVSGIILCIIFYLMSVCIPLRNLTSCFIKEYSRKSYITAFNRQAHYSVGIGPHLHHNKSCGKTWRRGSQHKLSEWI